MAHVIEPAKSGRASCRTCRQPIAKGELRFGEEVANAFSGGDTTHQWHHLLCAAKKKPAQLKEALAGFSGDVPNRAEVDAAMAAGPGKGEKPGSFPYAERASTGRSKCLECDEAIGKGEMRVAIEREVDTGSFVRKGPGYLHAACALDHTSDDDLLAKIKANAPGLPAEDVAELEEAFASGPGGGDDDAGTDEDDDDDMDDDDEDEDEEQDEDED